MTDPRTATLEFIDAQLRTAREAVAEWEAFRRSVLDGAPIADVPAPRIPLAPPAPRGRGARANGAGNGHRPKVRDAIVAVFRDNPTLEYDKKAVTAALADYHFSENGIRGVLYALRDENVITARRGPGHWSPTHYRWNGEHR